MMGLTAGVGNGAGATVMPILAGALITSFGWRSAYQGFALVIVVIGFPTLWLLLRDRPNVPTVATDAKMLEGVDLAEAARTPVFAVMLLSIGLGAGGLTAVFSHVVPILLDKGLSIEIATATIVSFALTCMFWQVVMGWLLDRVADPRIAAPFFLLPIGGLALLMRTDSPWALTGAGMLLGVGLGTEYGLLPYWVPRYFGRHAYGAIYGTIYGVIVLVMGVTPVLLDAVFDATGSYDRALYGVGAALLGGALLVLALRPYVYDRDGRRMKRANAGLARSPV
jgi:MFS family permease